MLTFEPTAYKVWGVASIVAKNKAIHSLMRYLCRNRQTAPSALEYVVWNDHEEPRTGNRQAMPVCIHNGKTADFRSRGNQRFSACWEAWVTRMSDIKDFNDPFDGKGFFYDAAKLTDIERLAPHGGWLIDDFNSYKGNMFIGEWCASYANVGLLCQQP